jgi:hypothetical protein
MTIKPLEKNDRTRYSEYAKFYGTIFNSLDWLSVFRERAQAFGIYNKNDELIGGFLLYHERKFGLSIYRTPPFTTSVGPFLKMDARNPSSISDTWKNTLNVIATFLDDLPYSVVSFSMHSTVVDTQPFLWKKFKVSPRYTYVLDLSGSFEDIMKKMSSERRHNISKAKKDGVAVKQTCQYGLVKSLIVKTFARQNESIDMSYLDRILFEFASDRNSFAFLALRNEEPIACIFCVYDNQVAYYLFGGYDSDNKHVGAGALAMWRAICHAKDMGLRWFDFEGSMISQVERFFRGFGGTLTPYYQINKARLPIEIILKFFKRETY